MTWESVHYVTQNIQDIELHLQNDLNTHTHPINLKHRIKMRQNIKSGGIKGHFYFFLHFSYFLNFI